MNSRPALPTSEPGARGTLLSERRAQSRAWPLLLAVLASVALVAVVVFLLRPASPAGSLADGLAGERWYVVAFRHTPIGHYRTRNGRTAAGDFEFRTELHFKLGTSGDETRIEDRLVFHQRPPHRLLLAQHRKSGDGATQTQVAIGDGYAETMVGDERRRLPVNTDFELGEYLTIERWLAATSDTKVGALAGEGATMSARAVDFDSLAIVTHQWRVSHAGENGVEIVKDDVRETRVLLDGDQVPLRMTIGGDFALQRVADEAAARVWERSAPLFATLGHQVHVDPPIADAPSLRHLVLAVDRGRDALWPGANRPALLRGEADRRTPAADAEIARARMASVSYPADDPRLLAMARRAIAGAKNQHQQADALTAFVHDTLRYHDSAALRSVYDTLRERRGDCTEYADLYTTLARAIGLPARTVVGLVYRADAQAFAPHAWNEVAIDRQWRGVDPTWGQTRLDATHLRLPDDWAVAALAELPRLEFRVVEARY